ncbi:hypothetical protein LshimejAT787_0905130 [Lyophyllum shimeji]|uniref:Uncharacterized protein n=1 Tax=Lyophyllum shimeji TaxID=47721 RepID=A0A9P3PTH7_LYOSH|nr:hypothetical protein LshimejAT787_0905130 [Lyophyllum shimeji]
MTSNPVMPMPRNLRSRTITTPDTSTVPKRTRRTAAQIKADQQKKADEEASKAKQNAKVLEDLAHHEHEKEKEAERRLLEANHPPSEMRVKTPRPQKPILAVSENIKDDDDDNYEADKTVQADSADAMLLDESDDEDQLLQKARTPAPKEKGFTVREKVDVLKASLAREEVGGKKRRKGKPIDLSFNKKPRQGIKTGLRDIPMHDEEENLEAPGPELLASLSSISETERKDNPEESEDEEPRGISDGEGDPVEKVGVAKNEKSAVRYRGRGQETNVVGSKVQSIAKIESTTSVPDYVSPEIRRELTQTPKPKARLGDDDLPSEVNKHFDEYFGPRLYEYFGVIRPWSPVKVDSDSEIIRLWAKYFPDQPSLDSEEPKDAELIRAVQNKVEGRLSNYRNKMTTVASDYLTKTLLPSLDSKGERAQWVADAIGEPDVWNWKPFYYKTINMVIGDDGEEYPEYKGIFQSPFVAKVFAVHYQFIKDISLVRRSKDKPTGALVLAVQACLHNLTLCKTGDRVVQPGKLSQFSANNCDDRHHVTEDNKLIEILATTKILKTVKRLTEKQWLKIIRAAVDMLPRSTVVMRSAVDVAAPSSDIEMIDADDSDD